jgi:hypothetical protein
MPDNIIHIIPYNIIPNNIFNIILKLVILIIIIYILFNCMVENFYDLTNLPGEFNGKIDDVNISPLIGIPKIIHHICPKDFKRWNSKWFTGYESWIRLFPKPEYTHMLWYDDELNKLVDEEFPWFSEIFNSYDVNIKRIDMIRPFFLYKYGGIYADMDYVVYKNFFDELPQDKVSIPESPYKDNEFIQNALLISPPKHNFWLLIIDECFLNKDKHVFEATGPQLYTNIYYKFPSLVNILPSILYNPHIGTDDFTSEKLYAKHLLTTMW